MAFARYREGDVDSVVALYHPRIELRALSLMGRPPESLRGTASVRAFLRDRVAQGMNPEVEGLEVVEVDGRVLAAGRLAPPASIRMHWTFEFEDELIRRIQVREDAGWAAMGDREFVLAQVADTPARGTVPLRLGEGRSLSAPIDDDLVDLAVPQAPVLVYFDQDGLAGWYLPDHQRGMVLG